MKITINGKRIDLPEGLTAKIREIIEAAEAEEKQPEPEKSPFERAESGEAYYYIHYTGGVECAREYNAREDAECYAVANYCTDEAMLEQRALHETLNRLLWRYSEEHGGDCEWDGEQLHWCIFRSVQSQFCTNYWCGAKFQGIVYFNKQKTAEAAIRDIVEPFIAAHPEFVW